MPDPKTTWSNERMAIPRYAILLLMIACAVLGFETSNVLWGIGVFHAHQ